MLLVASTLTAIARLIVPTIGYPMRKYEFIGPGSPAARKPITQNAAKANNGMAESFTFRKMPKGKWNIRTSFPAGDYCVHSALMQEIVGRIGCWQRVRCGEKPGRRVPIFSGLKPYRQAMREAVPGGAKHVIGCRCRANENGRTQLQPRRFQNLRSIGKTEFTERRTI